MKRSFLSGVTVAAALVGGDYALAESPEAREMLEMIEFITENSSLRYAGQDLPDVTVVPDNELQRLFRLFEAEISANKDGRSVTLVSALYDRFANRIFLSDVSGIAGPSLFHEMVHFLQAINDKNDMFAFHRTCLEAEAYDLQAIWQTERGIDLAAKPEHGFVMTLYGVCNDADFSWIDNGYSNADKLAGAESGRGQISD